jgi:hypothetical protein
MSDCQLPEELQRLERVLKERPHEGPSAPLRGRVMAGVQVRRQQSASGWWMAAGVAAAVLIWLNVSLSATNATEGPLPPRATHDPLEQVARQIQHLVPDLPHEEALRQAALYRSGSALVLCPDVPEKRLRDPTPTGWSGS